LPAGRPQGPPLQKGSQKDPPYKAEFLDLLPKSYQDGIRNKIAKLTLIFGITDVRH